MTPKQADHLIASEAYVTVKDRYGDLFAARFIKRDRRTIETSAGRLFEYRDLEVISD